MMTTIPLDDGHPSPSDAQRTEIPSDISHAKTLISHSFQRDMKKRKIYLAKIFLFPMLLMLYTIGFFIGGIGEGGDDGDNASGRDDNGLFGDINGYRFHPPESLSYPGSIRVGGADGELVSSVANNLYGIYAAYNKEQGEENDNDEDNDKSNETMGEDDINAPFTVSIINSDDDSNIIGKVDDVDIEKEDFTDDEIFELQFKSQCQQDGSNGDDDHPYTSVCVYLYSLNSYTIFYNGGHQEWVTPYLPPLAGTQDLINRALLYHSFSSSSDAVNNDTESFDVDSTFLPNNRIVNVQRIPEILNEDIDRGDSGADSSFLLVPGLMHVLSFVITLQFITGPLTFDKVNGVTKSYLGVGVKLTTYLLQWIVYFALIGAVTCLALSLVSIFWNLFPQSSFILIFLSHWLGYVSTCSQFVIIMQMIEQEELAKGIPWLVAMFSMAVGAVVIITLSVESVLLTTLSIFFPFIGMIQYYGIYVNYDFTGYDTGIHLLNGDNTFVESGLLGNMIAQVASNILWIVTIFLYANPELLPWYRQPESSRRTKQEKSEGALPIHDDGDTDRDDAFEPRPPGSEVLVSVQGVEHAYYPKCSLCGTDKTKPVEVLKGLDMEICRGEVFGYLGHNGAGKTTSINILSGETKLQDGNITYHFRSGDQSLVSSTDATKVRTRIGVCPQDNTMLQDDMTARETLRLFAHLKGGVLKNSADQSTADAVEAEVDRRLAEVNFTSDEDADKLVGTFSGGMKRKILIAVALLGDPEVVFLDEPTAGLDPYNRRTIWDMIIAAKQGRSIILTTHFLDEADVLSDRIGIIKNGKLITCGSSLFLKHHFGAGYELNYIAKGSPIDIPSIVPDAIEVPNQIPETYKWRLDHGTEPTFPDLLSKLGSMGATNVSLELTTLEQVFLETGKEDHPNKDDDDKDNDDDDDDSEEVDDEEALASSKTALLSKIWEPRGTQELPGLWTKFYLVQNFMMTNAWKIKGVIFLNVVMPLIYLVAGVVVAAVNENPEPGEVIFHDPISMDPNTAGETSYRFFGVPPELSVRPFQFTDEPDTVDYYFPSSTAAAVAGGYFAGNETLQYDPDVSPFALQIGLQLLTNVTAIVQGTNLSSSASVSVSGGISASVQEFPDIASETSFRVDLLVLPFCLAFGFSGVAFAVLDVILLKADNIIALFRVAGISEWMAYLGVASYKTTSTFCPFFVFLIVLGLALKLVLFGNGGRWLGTLLVMLGYAYSTMPMGLIIAKRFIHGGYKNVSEWFPGVYFTVVGLPYIAWSLALQIATDSRDTILIIGDIICIVPQVAFQRGLGAIIEVSTQYQDDDLSWGDVWSFESRVWFTIVMMFGVGTLEWVYLRSLTVRRELKTKLSTEEEKEVGSPVDVYHDNYIVRERERSLVDEEGINARDLVKVFRIPPSKDSKVKDPIIKQSVKGVSFGIRKNEIFALLGPNGAGKTTTMHMLAGQLTPEHGSIALDGKAAATGETSSIDYLYEDCKVSYCPQFDALFSQKTVEEHLDFYSTIRGLDLSEDVAKEHVNSIVKLLGLEKHRTKEANQLSGGYKRRLSLAVAMVGYPHVMMVDECTTGLDPGARRKIWNVLKPDVSNPAYDIPSILLSSHYMDECQELGTRIGIMIDGEVTATGTLIELQNRYCTSFFVEVAFSTTSADEDGIGSIAESKVIETFQQSGLEANIYESLPYHCKFQVPFLEHARNSNDDTRQLGKVFDVLESNKAKLGIKFYSVSKMNLEQIFIDLSRKQFEADMKFQNSIRSPSTQV